MDISVTLDLPNSSTNPHTKRRDYALIAASKPVKIAKQP